MTRKNTVSMFIQMVLDELEIIFFDSKYVQICVVNQGGRNDTFNQGTSSQVNP